MNQIRKKKKKVYYILMINDIMVCTSIRGVMYICEWQYILWYCSVHLQSYPLQKHDTVHLSTDQESDGEFTNQQIRGCSVMTSDPFSHFFYSSQLSCVIL